MADDDDGAGPVLQHVLQHAQRVEVEVVGRLVEQQHVGPGPQRQHELQPPPLAARQQADRRPLGIGVEPEPLEEPGVLPVGQPGRAGHGLVDPHRRVELDAALVRTCRARRWSPTSRCPRSARSVPAMTSSSVDLPAPLGPTMPSRSRGSSEQVDAAEQPRPVAEAVADAVQLDRRCRRAAARRSRGRGRPRARRPRAGPRRSPSPPRCGPWACWCVPAHPGAARPARSGPGCGGRAPGRPPAPPARLAPRGSRRTRRRGRSRGRGRARGCASSPGRARGGRGRRGRSPPRWTARRSSSQRDGVDVEVVGRLVEDQQHVVAGLPGRPDLDERPGERDPLGLAARQRGRSGRRGDRRGRACRGSPRRPTSRPVDVADGAPRRSGGVLVEHRRPGSRGPGGRPRPRARPGPASWRSSVDLPRPLRPTTASRSPDATVTETPANSGRPGPAGGQRRRHRAGSRPQARSRDDRPTRHRATGRASLHGRFRARRRAPSRPDSARFDGG